MVAAGSDCASTLGFGSEGSGLELSSGMAGDGMNEWGMRCGVRR